MHPHPARDAHKVRHPRTVEERTGWLRVFRVVDVLLYHVARPIHVISVERRFMIAVFLHDLVLPGRRAEALPPRRNDRNADEFLRLVKVRTLFAEADRHRWRALNVIPVPVRHVVEIRPLLFLHATPVSADVKCLIAEPRIVALAAGKRRQREKEHATGAGYG